MQHLLPKRQRKTWQPRCQIFNHVGHQCSIANAGPVLFTNPMPLYWLVYRHNNQVSVVIEPVDSEFRSAPPILSTNLWEEMGGVGQDYYPSQGDRFRRRRDNRSLALGSLRSDGR